MTVWTWLWLAWIAAFLGIEGVALFNATPGDTLSEHVWKWITQPSGRTRSNSVGWAVYAGRGVVLALLGWLGWHFLVG